MKLKVIDTMAREGTLIARICMAALCLAMVIGAPGCGSKTGSSDTKTPAEIEAFKGHQPTPAQLQAAMSRAVTSSPADGQSASTRP